MKINSDQENLNTTVQLERNQQNKKLVASELGDLFSIGNGWLEEPSTAADRKKLSNQS